MLILHLCYFNIVARQIFYMFLMLFALTHHRFDGIILHGLVYDLYTRSCIEYIIKNMFYFHLVQVDFYITNRIFSMHLRCSSPEDIIYILVVLILLCPRISASFAISFSIP